jgi:hypothetical protein
MSSIHGGYRTTSSRNESCRDLEVRGNYRGDHGDGRMIRGPRLASVYLRTLPGPPFRPPEGVSQRGGRPRGRKAIRDGIAVSRSKGSMRSGPTASAGRSTLPEPPRRGTKHQHRSSSEPRITNPRTSAFGVPVDPSITNSSVACGKVLAKHVWPDHHPGPGISRDVTRRMRRRTGDEANNQGQPQASVARARRGWAQT